MKPNKSIKTVVLWLSLIIIFVLIFQTLTGKGEGKPLTLSDFIHKAMPTPGTADEDGQRSLEEVVVRGKVIEYRVSRSGDKAREELSRVKDAGDDSAQAKPVYPAEESWFHTRGDLTMPMGGATGSTIFAMLAERGVPVKYEDGEATKVVPRGEEEPFSAFVALVQEVRPPTKIASITIRGKEITGRYKKEEHKKEGRSFVTVGELGGYRKDLIARGVEITEENEDEGSVWLSILGMWLPLIFIILIFFLFMRQLQAGGGKAMSFGKSRHRLLNEATNKVTFKDVAGIEEAKQELQEIIQFLKDPKKFTRLGGRIPKGVLLMGPPGTGKTLLAKGVAGEASVPFFTISGSDFVEMFVGVGASRVRDLFEQGKKNAPCILFIDEIDAVGRHRGAGLGGGHDEREQTLNQLLVEMDGFESNDGVILVAATNRPDVLDPALLRPGRFDRRVVVNRPDVRGRSEILKVHTRKTRLSDDVELSVIARGTPGFSGADLENLVNEAALLAARMDKDVIEMSDFEEAKDKVLMGAERRSAVLSDEEKRVTAYHEAGHALVAAKVPGNDPVHKVTIIPRGMALGLTSTLPDEDQYNLREEQVLGRIAMAMGGRVAEELVYDHVTTGAGNDIEQATKLARKMVCEWGMSRLGPIALTHNDGNVFLGRDLTRSPEYSEKTQSEADAEIKRIISECYDRAQSTIAEHRVELDAISDALIEFESLDGFEVNMLLEGKGLEHLREERGRREAASSEGKKRASKAASTEEGDAPPRLADLPEPVSTRDRLSD